MRAIIKWFENIVAGLLICIIIFSMLAFLQLKKNPNDMPTIMGYQPLSILSGSMRPVLESGDMIFIHSVSSEKIKAGDIITYWTNNETLITHRVEKIIDENGMLKYRTKGDANQAEDKVWISEDMILGKMVFNIPKGGYVSQFVRSKVGMILLIFLPISIIIGSEVRKRREKAEREN